MAATAFEEKVIEGLATLNARFTDMEKRLDDSKYDPRQCAVHEEKFKVTNKRLAAVERQQGKQNMITLTIGAVGSGLVLAAKYLGAKVGGA